MKYSLEWFLSNAQENPFYVKQKKKILLSICGLNCAPPLLFNVNFVDICYNFFFILAEWGKFSFDEEHGSNLINMIRHKHHFRDVCNIAEKGFVALYLEIIIRKFVCNFLFALQKNSWWRWIYLIRIGKFQVFFFIMLKY